MFTEYCCRLVVPSKYKEIAEKLDNYIKSKKYEEGVSYIDSLEVDEDSKRRLKNCLLSYKVSC